MNGQKWLTRAQAAERLGASMEAVGKWSTKGLLERRTPGRGGSRPGLCECGCGKPAPVAGRRDTRRGSVKGQPIRFIHGHNNALYVTAASVERLKALRGARRAVSAARERMARLALAGDGPGLLEATVAVAQAKADLLVLEMEV